MKKLSGESLSIINENVQALSRLFPEAVAEGKVNFEILRQLLGNSVDVGQERYSFTWNGKSDALHISQTSSLGTLRPCKEESKNWDMTRNIYIEGDNLEVLKLLQKSYYGKVKMIYIDPPYNTGNDFVYRDDFKDSIDNYKHITGQIDGNGRNLATNIESNGRFHTDWLNMIYPRLRLARNLLTEDGVIFISIDDHEQANLKKVCDEIFGEGNFVAQLIWEKKKKGAFLAKTVTNVKEYILVYCKSMFLFSGLIGEINRSMETYPCINAINRRERRLIPKGIESKYRDKNFFQPAGTKISDTTMDIVYLTDLIIKNGRVVKEFEIEGNWRYSQELMTQYALNGELYLTQDLYLRRIVNEPRQKMLKDILSRVGDDNNSTIDFENLFASGWGSNEDADEELRLIFCKQKFFSYPKPTRLIAKLLYSMYDKESIIMDFFSGSATTAHAVMQLNAEDGGNRKFIMVQIPELTPEDSEAAKAGYKNICEIGKERIRRAGEKIKAESGDEAPDLDIGFRVFKLDSSNLKKWNSQTKDTMQSLIDSLDNFLPGRTELDVAYEILLKMGIELSTEIEEREVIGEKIYIVDDGSLMICLGENITFAITDEIIKLHKEYNSELWQVVFRDTGFVSDMDKTNIKETLKTAGLKEDNFVCI